MIYELPLFKNKLDPLWKLVLERYLSFVEMQKLNAFVEKEYETHPGKIYPQGDLIFNALNRTPFSEVKAVIVGQDPYHGPGQAQGLSFSVMPGVPFPPSLRNILKELQSHTDVSSTPSHGCLSSWASQGILLLNATLTVRDGSPLSHRNKGWEHFTDAVLMALSDRTDPVIFVLWGNSAQGKCGFLERRVNADYILKAAHPSPLSAFRGFFGCNHFTKINELLYRQGKRSIDWTLR